MSELFSSVAIILVSVVCVGIFVMLAWKFYYKPKCPNEINATKETVVSQLMSCSESCWSRHGFGKDTKSEDCYVVKVFLKDSELRGSDLETNYVVPMFESIDIGSEVQLKIRYDASLKKIVITVFE